MPITVKRITDAALQVVAAERYDVLTIRRVADVLGPCPSSLYAHIVNKDDLDDLLIGRLFVEVVLPGPDPAAWREQLLEVYAQIRDLYLKYPGTSRAAPAMAPTHLGTLRVGEGALAILLAGGIEPKTADWARDALSLYVSAYAVEQLLVQQPLATDRVRGRSSSSRNCRRSSATWSRSGLPSDAVRVRWITPPGPTA
jgi:AcrR family transcriptional regulator